MLGINCGAQENLFHVKPVVPWEIGVGDHFDPSNKQMLEVTSVMLDYSAS
jgi:hypothetical protein